MIQVFFHTPKGRLVGKQLNDTFTFDEVVKATSEVLGGASREETVKYQLVVQAKRLVLDNAEAFNRNKHYIINECLIFVLLRLSSFGNLQDALHTIAMQQLETELEKLTTSSAECSHCLDADTACIKVCCAWICRKDFKEYLVSKEFKATCTVCRKPLVLADIFKTKEYVATLRALDEEKELLRNMDCQRCMDCGILMFNETMFSQQTCKCGRVFCFFCSHSWVPASMKNAKNTCSKTCVYETKITFELVPFHHRRDMMIPSQRTCPKCFALNVYDEKTKYHTCPMCKFTYCFLCLEEQSECERKYASNYDHACVATLAVQTYDMFPRLATA